MMINENSSELMETADSNYESIRKKLVLRLFHQQGNEAIMDQYPYRKVLDLFLICEIQQEWESEDEASTVVTKEMLKQWNIPEDKLFEDAMEAAPRNEPYNFRKIEDVLMEYKADMVFPKAEDVSLYATFTYHAPTTYCNINLSVETDGDASDTSGGTVSGGGQVREGTSVTVTATPAQYYHFAHWRENGAIVSSDNPYTFTANSSRSLVARFLQDISYSESIGITHNAGESITSYTISGPVHSGVNITVHYTYQYDTGDGSASASFTQGSSGSKTDSHTGITISYAGGKTIKVSGGDTGSITLTSVRVML